MKTTTLLILVAAQLSRCNPITYPFSIQTAALDTPATLTATSSSSSSSTLTPPTGVATSLPTAPADQPDSTRAPGPTAAPSLLAGDLEGELDGMIDPEVKFRQTTYYSCVTWPHTVHCGWHRPILDAGGSRPGYDSNKIAVRAGVAAGIIGGLVLAA